MKTILLLLFSLIFAPFFLHAQADSIIIGSGGGFSGVVKDYKISREGVLRAEGSSHGGHTNATKTRSAINKKDAVCILKNAELISVNYPGIDFPFNTYKFLEIYGKGKQVKYTWGNPAHAAPESIQKYYNDVMTTISNLHFRP